MDGLDCDDYAPTPGPELVKGVLSHAAAARRNKDHVVAVVDVRRAYFYAEPIPKTFVELPDYYDLDTQLRRCSCGTRQAARSWQREIETGNKAAGMVMGNWWVWCTATTSCSQDRDHLLLQHGSLYESALRHENT